MLLMTLLLICLTNGMSILINEECLSNNIKEYEIRKEDVVPITTYLTDEYNILFQISFEDRMEGLDMDYIKVKPNSYEITRKRNGVASKDILNTSIPFGWVNMNITASKHVFDINPYIGNISSEYPMQHLSIASQYLSSCEQGTPSWNILRNKAISIPLNNIGRSQISLTSEKDFSPFFTIIGSKYYLTDEYGISLGSSGMKLLANTYTFIFEIENNNFRLSYKKEECDLEVLVSLKLKTKLWNITVGTLDEDLILVLEPMIHHSSICEITSEIYGNITESTQQSNDNIGLVMLALILALFLMTTVIILILLKLNGPKYAPIFHLQIQSDQKEDKEQMQMSSRYDVGTDEPNEQQKNKLVETGRLLHSNQSKNTESNDLHQQLEGKNAENYNLGKSLQEYKTKNDKLDKSLKGQYEANVFLQQQIKELEIQNIKEVNKGEVYRILHIINAKEDPIYEVHIRSDLSEEFNKEVLVNGQDSLNVLLTILQKFPDDKVVQSAGMQLLMHMKEHFSNIGQASRQLVRLAETVFKAFEADADNIDVSINSCLILREAIGFEKSCTRVFRAALRHITLNKDPKIVTECLKCIYHIITKEKSKESEDLIEECFEIVIKAFECFHSVDITINSCRILQNIIENEKPMFYDRIVNAALKHIANNKKPLLVSECLKILYRIFTNTNSDKNDEIMERIVESALKAFEDSSNIDININSSLILRRAISIRKEKIKGPELLRMAQASAIHIEYDNDPKVKANCLAFWNELYEVDTNQMDGSLDSLIQVVLNLLKTNIKCDENDDLHGNGWKTLKLIVSNSVINIYTIIDKGGLEVILLYLQKFHASIKVTETVLATSSMILNHCDLRRMVTNETLNMALYCCLLTGKSVWVKTSAAECICKLGGDDLGKSKGTNIFFIMAFNKLVENVENNRLQLCDVLDLEKKIKRWRGLKVPEPKHFHEIKKHLVPENSNK